MSSPHRRICVPQVAVQVQDTDHSRRHQYQNDRSATHARLRRRLRGSCPSRRPRACRPPRILRPCRSPSSPDALSPPGGGICLSEAMLKPSFQLIPFISNRTRLRYSPKGSNPPAPVFRLRSAASTSCSSAQTDASELHIPMTRIAEEELRRHANARSTPSSIKFNTVQSPAMMTVRSQRSRQRRRQVKPCCRTATVPPVPRQVPNAQRRQQIRYRLLADSAVAAPGSAYCGYTARKATSPRPTPVG